MRKISKIRIVYCVVCGKKFKTTHSQGKYCSIEHKKEGARKSWRDYNNRNKSYRQKYHRDWYKKNKENRLKQIRKWQKSPSGKKSIRLHDLRMIIKYPQKYLARQEVLKAIRKKILIKKPCKICGNPKSEAHHKDYSKPLQVEWLCSKHHKIIDKKSKNGHTPDVGTTAGQDKK